MILEFIASAITGIIFSWLYILPTFTGLPSNVDEALTTLTGYLSKANSFFPLDTLFTIAGIIFTIELALYTIKMFNWIFNKIRGSG